MNLYFNRKIYIKISVRLGYLLCSCLMGRWNVTIRIYATPYHRFCIIKKSNIGAETQELTHENACTTHLVKGVLVIWKRRISYIIYHVG